MNLLSIILAASKLFTSKEVAPQPLVAPKPPLVRRRTCKSIHHPLRWLNIVMLTNTLNKIGVHHIQYFLRKSV